MILVTGAAGFIGWKTSGFLLERGREVVGIDNMNDYYDVRLKEHRLKGLKKHGGFHFQGIDIEDVESLDRLFRDNRIETVINLAARAGVRYSIDNPRIYMTTNAMGTLNLLEMMNKHGTKKLVLASTSSLYAGQPIPFREDLPVNTPISPYAASKKAAEVMAYSYHYLYGLDISVLRYFTVYGPAGRPDMSIFRFIKWIDTGQPLRVFGDASQTRDFTYIDDIADGTVRAMKDVGYEIINLGGGKTPHSLIDVIKKIEGLLGRKAVIEYLPFNRADLMETMADISKARRVLGWKPETDLDTGLGQCVEWYLKNRTWLDEISL